MASSEETETPFTQYTIGVQLTEGTTSLGRLHVRAKATLASNPNAEWTEDFDAEVSESGDWSVSVTIEMEHGHPGQTRGLWRGFGQGLPAVGTARYSGKVVAELANPGQAWECYKAFLGAESPAALANGLRVVKFEDTDTGLGTKDSIVKLSGEDEISKHVKRITESNKSLNVKTD